MYCPNCNNLNVDDASFCTACGCSLAVQLLTCPNCGSNNNLFAQFCVGCGYPFQQEEVSFQNDYREQIYYNDYGDYRESDSSSLKLILIVVFLIVVILICVFVILSLPKDKVSNPLNNSKYSFTSNNKNSEGNQTHSASNTFDDNDYSYDDTEPDPEYEPDYNDNSINPRDKIPHVDKPKSSSAYNKTLIINRSDSYAKQKSENCRVYLRPTFESHYMDEDELKKRYNPDFIYCGTKVQVLDYQEPLYKIRTPEGEVGWIYAATTSNRDLSEEWKPPLCLLNDDISMILSDRKQGKALKGNRYVIINQDNDSYTIIHNNGVTASIAKYNCDVK